jgi:uncharacterized protein
MSEREISRRDFVRTGAASAAAVALTGSTGLASGSGGEGGGPPGRMAERPLGRTGHNVKLFSLGGQAVIERPDRDAEAEAIINRALDLGVNYIDTAASYGRGISERYIGRVMATRRGEAFLASKTNNRTRDGALEQLETSLRNLQTDHLDLWQLHNVRRTDELDTIFGAGGAMEALIRARDEKMVRFLGITGHFDPAVLIDGLNRFDFDTILLALNPSDPHHLPFQTELLRQSNEKRLGIIAMKIPGRNRLFRPGAITRIKEPMEYVLTLPVSTCIIGCENVQQLEENIRVAAEFQPLSRERMAELEAVTASYVADGSWYKRDVAGAGPQSPDDQQMDD